MALFHLSVTQTKRSAGQSAIASGRPTPGAGLYIASIMANSDYTRKGGVIRLRHSPAVPCTARIRRPPDPMERRGKPSGKNAQLVYSFDIALQNEFSLRKTSLLQGNFCWRTLEPWHGGLTRHTPARLGGRRHTKPAFSCVYSIRPHRAERANGDQLTPGMSWTRTATVSGTRTESLFSTPFPLPTGAVPKRWNIGVKHGRRCAMPSLRKKVLMFVSTTAAMNGKADLFLRHPWLAKPSAMEKKGIRTEKGEFNAGSCLHQCRYPGH